MRRRPASSLLGALAGTSSAQRSDPAKTPQRLRFDWQRSAHRGQRVQRTGQNPFPSGGRHCRYLALLRKDLPHDSRPFAWHPSHEPPHLLRVRHTATSSSRRPVRNREKAAKFCIDTTDAFPQTDDGDPTDSPWLLYRFVRSGLALSAKCSDAVHFPLRFATAIPTREPSSDRKSLTIS